MLRWYWKNLTLKTQVYEEDDDPVCRDLHNANLRWDLRHAEEQRAQRCLTMPKSV